MKTDLSHLQRQLSKLRDHIDELGSQVLLQVIHAMQAFNERNETLAEKVIAKDDEIDIAEVDIEEECLKILALYQPVARDLRYLVAIMKINNDLERIGDLAVNIAKRALYISSQKSGGANLELNTIMIIARQMLEKSLESMMDMNPKQAQEVRMMDDEVDNLNRVVFQKALHDMQENPEQLETLLSQLNACRNLERIADHATNIAEDVIYMAQGNIVRHNQN